jgi:hypothetical protein
MTTMRAHQRNQRGQSAIEGALVVVVLIGIILAAIDIGQVIFLHQTLAERARGAARYAALHPNDPDGARNMVLYGRATEPGGARSGFGGLTPRMVDVKRVNSETSEDAVVVTVSNYPLRFFSFWLAGAMHARPIVASSPVEI